MRRLLILSLLLTSMALIGCERTQVVSVQSCSKVVGTKYYRNKVLGVDLNSVKRYYVLEDGREIADDDLASSDIRNWYEYCETKWVPGKGMEPV